MKSPWSAAPADGAPKSECRTSSAQRRTSDRVRAAASPQAFRDPRAEIVFEDALEYVRKTDRKFTVVILDLPSPIRGGPAYRCYTREFLERVRRIMSKTGILVLQADSFSMTDVHVGARIAATLRRLFPTVLPYAAYVPSFGALWGFLIASRADLCKNASPGRIDERIREHVSARRLRFYDGLAHLGLFNLPKYLRKALSMPAKVVTEASPVFVFT